MKYTSHNLEESQTLAKEFISNLIGFENEATIVGLYGDLGAGKTSFTQGIAKALGVGDTVVSPTFVIEKIYEIIHKNFSHLIHIDAYRLEKSEELLHLGWSEIISDPKNLILIEWPEKVADIMPKHIKINFSHISENERSIEIVQTSGNAIIE